MAHLRASEAVEITQQAVVDSSFEVLEALKKIKITASKGMRNCLSDWPMSEAQLKMLRNLGYSILYIEIDRPTISW